MQSRLERLWDAKLQLGGSGSRSFQDRIPKLELGNQPKMFRTGLQTPSGVNGTPVCAQRQSNLKNPSYAGTYVFGRHQSVKKISADGVINCQSRRMPMDKWTVTIHNHHEGYISWEEYLENQKILGSMRIVV